MPRYFFHRTDGGISIDREGTDLPDLDSARKEAILFAAETLRDQPGWATSGELRVDVTDINDVALVTVVIAARTPTQPLRLVDGVGAKVVDGIPNKMVDGFGDKKLDGHDDKKDR